MPTAKLPAIMLYTGDWLKDPELSKCSPSTRGIWIDAICAMHESARCGVLEGTPEQLSRVLRSSPADVLHAARELQATGAGTVTERNGVVTLINRRMLGEHKERIQAALRQKKAREKPAVTPESRTCHDNVTPSSSVSTSISSSNSEEKRPAGAGPPPKKGKRTDAFSELNRHFSESWARKYEKPYPFRQVDGIKLAELLKACGGCLDDAKAVLDRYLGDDSFFVNGHSPQMLMSGSQLPRYFTDHKGNKNGKHPRPTAADRGEFAENLKL